MLTCNKCGQEKELTEFYKDGKKKDGTPRYRPDCKACYNVKYDAEARKKTDEELGRPPRERPKKQNKLPSAPTPSWPAQPKLQDSIEYPDDDWDPGA